MVPTATVLTIFVRMTGSLEVFGRGLFPGGDSILDARAGTVLGETWEPAGSQNAVTSGTAAVRIRADSGVHGPVRITTA